MTEPVDPSDADPARVSKPASPVRSRRRETLALVIGGGVGLLVVIAVLLTTLSSSDSDDPPAEGASAGAGSTTTLLPLAELNASITVPPGDYTQLCAQFAPQLAVLRADPTLADVRKVYETVDFDALIAASPDGLDPSLATMRDQRDQVLPVLEQVSDIMDLGSADLPKGFIEAFATVALTATKKCP